MKAEHRHELQTNILAEWLEDTIEKLKPYTRAIIGVLVALLIILGVYTYVGSSERRAQAAASDKYIEALNSLSITGPQELQGVIEQYKGTQPAALSQLVLAEFQLTDGTNALYTNKPAARDSLSRAAGDFALAEQATRDPMLRAWAQYGLGRAYESMGNLDRARTEYQSLITDYPDSALIEAAKSHLAHLNQQGIKEFYDWFAKQDPRPEPLDKSTGIPGKMPGFDLSEPSTGDIKMPSFGTKDSQPADSAPSGATPAAGDSGSKTTPEPKTSPEPKSPAESKSPATPKADSKSPADAKAKK
jgi:tetratricopeptide (TPR) repeat protein